MANKTRLRAVSAEGVSLNAEFSLAVRPDGFALTLELRSGAADGDETPRNRDYERFMGLLFQRAAALDALLTGAWVASARTSNLNEADRLLRAEAYPYPIDLGAVADLETRAHQVIGGSERHWATAWCARAGKSEQARPAHLPSRHSAGRARAGGRDRPGRSALDG